MINISRNPSSLEIHNQLYHLLNKYEHNNHLNGFVLLKPEDVQLLLSHSFTVKSSVSSIEGKFFKANQSQRFVGTTDLFKDLKRGGKLFGIDENNQIIMDMPKARASQETRRKINIILKNLHEVEASENGSLLSRSKIKTPQIISEIRQMTSSEKQAFEQLQEDLTQLATKEETSSSKSSSPIVIKNKEETPQTKQSTATRPSLLKTTAKKDEFTQSSSKTGSVRERDEQKTYEAREKKKRLKDEQKREFIHQQRIKKSQIAAEQKEV